MMPQISLNFIDGSISSYCYILNSPKIFEQKRQVTKLGSVLCDLESDHTREKEEKNKRAAEVEENRRHKYEEKQGRENKDRLRGLDSCEDFSLLF